ncbi:ScbA/BarX family gamma-butyrolactone biosynthesis protein [Streptomyces sp. NPDC057877]|uniref:ScbA/BarX family gamma-butyrolactone biosynthesis protein n=1 Tax=Streptomyces sp. NPDC057877 TaxID=3346269 RepID=UPI0036BEC3F6
MTVLSSATAPSTTERIVPPPQMTIPQQYVHRSHDADVLLSHFTAEADGTYRLAVRWPRAHALFPPAGGGRENPMLMAETVRQSGAVVSHVVFDAPLDQHFLLWNLRYEVPADVYAAALPLAPTEALVRCTDVRLRGRKLSEFRTEVELYRGSLLVGRGDCRATCVSDAAYRRLRPPRPRPAIPAPPLPPVAPARVGRDRVEDVLISESGSPGTWLLRVDRDHPVIFDSQSDHVPGRALIEAMRQTAAATTGRGQSVAPALDAEFHRYVELDEPCALTAEPGPRLSHGRTSVRVTLHQSDVPAATGLVTLGAADRDPAP